MHERGISTKHGGNFGPNTMGTDALQDLTPHLACTGLAVHTHNETVPFSLYDVRHDLILQATRVHGDQGADDPTVRIRDDEMVKHVLSPDDLGQSDDEKFSPAL